MLDTLSFSTEIVSTALSASVLACAGVYYMGASWPVYNKTSAQAYSEINEAISTIDDIASLRDGWADEGSLAPSPFIISIAKAAAQTIYAAAPYAEISAMPNGTIAFDWETENGSANLEIGDDNFSFYLDLEGAFYPLAGASNRLPLEQLGEIINSYLSPIALSPVTSPTSYSVNSFGAIAQYA